MESKIGVRLLGIAGLFAIVTVLAVACGVSQKDYDALKQSLSAKEQEAAAAKQQVTSKDQELAKAKQDLLAAQAAGQQVTTLQQQVTTLQGQVTAKEQELAKAKQDLLAAQAAGQQTTALQQQVTTLQGQVTAKEQELAAAKKGLADATAAAAEKAKNSVLAVNRNVPPRATATPVPPGFVPPPPAAPAPTATPKFVQLAFYVDTVVAGNQETPYGVDAVQACVMSSIFVRGQRVVWRSEVIDTSTGKVLRTADVKSAVVKIPGVTPDKVLRYGRRFTTAMEAAGIDPVWFWATSWDIPPDYPLGKVDFTIEVETVDGKKGTWKQIQYFDPARDVGGRLPVMQVVP